MTRALLVVALAAAVALLPAPPAPGCAIAPPAGQRASTVGETAVIIWDDVAKVEHFTRAAIFAGSSADFGFLVPTPTEPTVADAPGPISSRLEDVTKPRTVVRKRLGEFGCLPQTRFTTVGAALPPPAAAPVQVVRQGRVGDRDYAVLKATDAGELRGWLGRNGYAARPELQGWLKGYVDDDYYLTAFKVANSSPSAALDRPGGYLKAVRLSFPAVVPFYPYQEPADAATPPSTGWFPPRVLKLFVLAPARVEALNGPGRGAGTAWQVRTVWAGTVEPAVVESTAAACGLPPAEATALAGRSWTLTEFEDGSNPRPAGADLTFRPSPDQSPVERPPHVIYEDIYWPYTAGGAGLAVLGPVLVWAVWRGVRRLIRNLPAAPLD